MEKYYFKGNINTDPYGHTKIIDFYNACRQIHEKEIELDLTHLNFFDANLCALLSAVLYLLKKHNRHRFVLSKQFVQKFDIFARNGFLISPEGEPILPDDRQSAVRLQSFAKTDDEGFVTYLEEDLFGHRGLITHSGHKEDLIEHMLEIFANIDTHAATTDPVYVCGQYYPKQGELKFTMVDLGVGFLEPIARHTRNAISTSEAAIRWAIQGNTTKTDASGGLGLSQLNEYCSEGRGNFHIVTGDSYWRNYSSGYNVEVPPFVGTTINLVFKY